MTTPADTIKRRFDKRSLPELLVHKFLTEHLSCTGQVQGMATTMAR
jgi:hypothetical protein